MDWELGTLIQLLLWPEDWLEALTVGTPKRRNEPRAVQALLPPAVPAAPTRLLDAAYCGRKIRALRTWRMVVQQQYVAAGKPAEIKALLDRIDSKTGKWVERLWACWGTAEQPAWKKAS